MRVLAVVPCWNALDRLPSVLGALEGQVEATFVFDNRSTDGSAEWLRDRQPAELLRLAGTNLGFPAAVNAGLGEARRRGADAVLLVNDDAVFQPGAVEALAGRMLAEPSAGAVSARMLYRDRPGVLNGAGGRWWPRRARAALRGAGEPDRGQYDDLPEVDYPSGAASLLRMAAVDRVGGMDERFYLYFEDADWGLRARAAGWRTLYAPGAVALHVGSAGTAARPARRRYYNVRNRLLLASLHAPVGGHAWAWLETLWLAGRQPARWLWRWRRDDAEAVLAGVLDHVAGRYGRSTRFG